MTKEQKQFLLGLSVRSVSYPQIKPELVHYYANEYGTTAELFVSSENEYGTTLLIGGATDGS